MAYIGEKIFIMGSLTGKISKGILDDFIFKAALWRTGCFKSSVPGKREQTMETQRLQRSFVKAASTVSRKRKGFTLNNFHYYETNRRMTLVQYLI